MPSTSAREVQVKAEAVEEAEAKAKVDIDLNQKIDHQATVPIVAVAIHLNNVKPLAKNAITVIKRPFFTVL